MSLQFATVGVIARSKDAKIKETLTAVMGYCDQQNVKVLTDKGSKKLCETCFTDTQIIPREDLGQRTDLLICVGGDGNLLHSSQLAIRHDTPVLGVNRGRLGFLTDIHPHELDKIGDVLRGEYSTDERTVIHTQVMRESAVIHEETALNDAVLHPAKVAHMIDYNILINEQDVCHQRADGLIVSTPTGSTAYALSGGGPIIHPKLNAFLLVPMFPHTLTNRPLVISDDDVLEIRFNQQGEEAIARFSCDGSPETMLMPRDKIIIKQYPKKLKLIHPANYHYYHTLRDKLGWAKSS